MRIWDLPPERLCRSHPLGEHRELHAIWSVLTGDQAGYRNHPGDPRGAAAPCDRGSRQPDSEQEG